MRKLTISSAVIAMALLPACATTQSSFFDRSVIEDAIVDDNIFGTLALTGERRLAIFNGKKTCAEALPDVARSIDTSSQSKSELDIIGQASGSFTSTEAYKTALEVIYKRTEKSDLVRQIGWQVCQAFMNDAIDENQYADMLVLMMKAALASDEKNASEAFTKSLTTRETTKF